MIVVLRLEAEDRERVSKEWYARADALLKSSKVQSLLDAVEAYLVSLKSAVAIYRSLKGVVYVSGTEQTFRRHLGQIGGIGRWIRTYARPDDLLGYLKLFGKDDPELVKEIEALKEVWRKSQMPLSADGGPLCPG